MINKNKVGLSKSLPFWSWNDKLEKSELLSQIEWMYDMGFGGFFMHARAGLKTGYLSDEWFSCVEACVKKAEELGMEAWAYDENGWPSGFVGGTLLENENNREWFLRASVGIYDKNALASYDIEGSGLKRVQNFIENREVLNVYKNTSVSTVDILDGDVVEKFLNATHEVYKKTLKDDFQQLKGFFTDEPQYYRAGIPYPHKIEEEFFNTYSEDILDGLGLLFTEKEGFRQFRYRYWKICQRLMLKNWAEKIYLWCDENHIKLTGHYVEERDLFAQMLFNGGVMPFYEYEHIPGIDWLCRRFMSVVPARQVGSVAAQLGKKEVLTETFAMTGWDVTPKELKALAEYQYLYGVNKMCQHLLPYSERGERKSDYPMHFTPLNPWLSQGMPLFNKYFDWLGGLMQESVEPINVAVLHPIRSAYFYYRQGKAESTAELDGALLALCDRLARNQIGFHFIDETLFAKYGFVEGAKIGCGKCAYDYLIIPKCYTMDKTTERALREFIEDGGKVYLADEKPTYLEGDPFGYSYLESNVTFEEIKETQPYTIETSADNLYSVYRKSSSGDFIMVLNIEDKVVAQSKIKLKNNVSIAEYDFNGDTCKQVGENFTLEPFQSKIFFVGERGETTDEKPCVVVGGEAEVLEQDDNCLLLDYAQYKTEGMQSYSKRYPLKAIFKQLLEERYEGNLRLQFSFQVASIPQSIKIEEDYGDNAEIYVNGKKLQTRVGNIAQLLFVGENNIEITLHFYENENVYLALFGENVTETLKNCLVYDTYLDNVYLSGNFGVFAKKGFESGQEQDVLLAEDFYIAERKKYVGELVESGEPFFAGRVFLRKTIKLENPNVRLKLLGRIHFARIRVNAQEAGVCLFDDIIDISAYTKLGENQIEIELFTGLRNKFGPHHDSFSEENLMVGVGSFEMFDEWSNFNCSRFRDKYAFVKSGLRREEDSFVKAIYMK